MLVLTLVSQRIVIPLMDVLREQMGLAEATAIEFAARESSTGRIVLATGGGKAAGWDRVASFTARRTLTRQRGGDKLGLLCRCQSARAGVGASRLPASW